ncbi:carboxymuconolactone decarboxylase family protein [Amorphus sp. MBR-141]
MTEDEKAELKSEILRARGYWSRFHEVLLERSPAFLKAYLAFQSAPSQSGELPQKLCEFVYIAIDISVNHMYERGGRRHMEYALKAGASPEEVLQVILLTTAVAAQQPLAMGMRVLAEELGEAADRSPLPPALSEAIEDYRGLTGAWPEAGDFMARTAPEIATAYMDYGRAAWEAGPLSRKHKELIALAISAAPTCLFEEGVRRHVRGARAAGATPREIAMVIQLSAALAVHTCTIGVPGFDDVMNGIYVE